MGSLFSTPKPPSAKKQAEAQQAVNQDQAALGQAYNRPNQYDPFGGAVQWSQTGTDANGNPIFSQTTSLGQTGQQYAGGLAGLGQQYFNTAGQGIPDSSAAFNQAYDLASANLEPRFERSRAALESRLRNQGLDPTSEAYRTAMNDSALQQNEARNNLVTNLQGQMFGQSLAGRQQQLGELQPGLAFGSQVLNPGGAMAPFMGVNTGSAPNMPQIMQQNYQAELANQQGLLGGLATLGGTILGGPIGGAIGGGLGNVMSGKPWSYGSSWAPSVTFGG